MATFSDISPVPLEIPAIRRDRASSMEAWAVRLRQLRDDDGLTQAELARHLGYESDRAVRDFETGARKPPSKAIARYAAWKGVAVTAMRAFVFDDARIDVPHQASGDGPTYPPSQEDALYIVGALLSLPTEVIEYLYRTGRNHKIGGVTIDPGIVRQTVRELLSGDPDD